MADPFSWGLGCTQCGCDSPPTTCTACPSGPYALIGTFADANGSYTLLWSTVGGFWYCCTTVGTHAVGYRVYCLSVGGVPTLRFEKAWIVTNNTNCTLKDSVCVAGGGTLVPAGSGVTGTSGGTRLLSTFDVVISTLPGSNPLAAGGTFPPVGFPGPGTCTPPVSGPVSASIPKIDSGAICCSPCAIPGMNLTLSWANSVSGPGSATLTYNSGTPNWTYSGTVNGQTLAVTLSCNSGSIQLNVTWNGSGGNQTVTSASCSPFDLVYSATGTVATAGHFTGFEVTP